MQKAQNLENSNLEVSAIGPRLHGNELWLRSGLETKQKMIALIRSARRTRRHLLPTTAEKPMGRSPTKSWWAKP